MADTMQLRQIAAALLPHAEQAAQYADFYAVCRITDADLPAAAMPRMASFAGLGIMLVSSGELSVEYNLKITTLQAGSLVMFGGNSQLRFVTQPAQAPQCSIDCLLLSGKLLRDLNIDLNSLNLHKMMERPPSAWLSSLTESETDSLSMYMQLLRLNALHSTEAVFKHNITRSLVQALIYQLMQMHTAHAYEREPKQNVPSQSRQLFYVQEFMRLVQIHHSAHRNMAFYAEKLFISPKYLAQIIKKGTGRSASDLIANFVISEAKNMLRFSNRSVQQVAYALGFTTQSAFGKYFKHFTGLSPSDFKASKTLEE